ncbi:MAG: hypothetical protein ABL886_04335 [Rhodoglobus sp.]
MPPVRGSASRRAPARARRAPDRILILECDSDKLAAQGLALGQRLAEHPQWNINEPEVTLATLRSADDVDDVFDDLGRKRYRGIVLIAHSNANIACLAPQVRERWTELGKRLRPLRPEKVILFACKGGMTKVGHELFRAVPSLKRIYASPANVSRRQASSLCDAAALMLAQRNVSPDVRQVLQGLHFLVNNGLFFELRREQFSTAKGRRKALVVELGLRLLQQHLSGS